MRTLLLLVVLPLAWAQFPAVCNTLSSLSTKTCCPDNCGSRGTCVSIREEIERSWDSANATIVKILRGLPGWPQDVRYQWPLQIFERVCSCSEGWGGHDCSQCDFGFIANEAGECVKRNSSQLLVRRNFMHLSKQERLNYIRLVNEAKNGEKKEWAILTTMPEEANDYYELQNVSTYDMFVFTHFLSIREKENTICPDVLIPNNTEQLNIHFAHKSSPFLPWHRYFLMRYESELQRIGERLGISNDFALPFWDWTPTDTCLIFTHELFGTPEYNDKVVNVSGTLFENGNWPTVCDSVYREYATIGKGAGTSDTECVKVRTLCDIEGDRKKNLRLQRGSFLVGQSGMRLPDYEAVAMTLIPDHYEGNYGFGNRLEGGIEQCTGEAVKCMFLDVPKKFRCIHAAVHEYVGGHIAVGEAAVNDPLFFLHHGNVDRIFERWLQKYNGDPPSYKPISGGPPGHNLNDYFVPLFPVKKLADVYKESKELGYIYDELSWSIPATDYQVGCPMASDQCDKGGYPRTVLVNATSANCTRIRQDPKLNGGV